MEPPVKHRHRAALLYILLPLLFLLPLIGLSMLFYLLGEQEAYPLPGGEALVPALMEQLRLGHLIEVDSGGTYVLEINGVTSQYRFLTPMERLGSSFVQALSLSFGPAVMEETSVNELLLSPGLSHLFTALIICLGPAFALAITHWAKRSSRWAMASFGLSFLPLIALFVLGFARVNLFALRAGLLALFVFFLCLGYRCSALYEDTPSALPIYGALALLGLCLLPGLAAFEYFDSSASLWRLFYEALGRGDNHVYAPCFFFLLLPYWVLGSFSIISLSVKKTRR